MNCNYYFTKVRSVFCLFFSFIAVISSYPCVAHEGMAQEEHASSENLTSALTHVINHQLQAIKDDNLDAAYYLYTSDEFQKNTRLPQFREFVQSMPAFYDYLTVGYGDAKEEDGNAYITVALFTQEGKIPLNYVLVEEGGEWKIWSMMPTDTEEQEVAMVTDDQTEQQDIKATIEDHLNKIKRHEAPEVYHKQLSSEFTKSTSPEKYDEFIKTQPELTEFRSIQIGDIKTEGKIKIVPVKLLSDQGERDITFYFAHEDGQWKIWGLHLEKAATSPLENEHEEHELVAVIEKQLEALQAKDFSKAYNLYTSDEFKKVVNFEQFQEFVHEYPVLTEQNEFNKIDVLTEGKLRLVRLALTSENHVTEFDYRLVKEDNQWKVWGIQVFTEVMFSKTPQDKEDVKAVIEKQLAAIHSGDLSTAYTTYTSKEFQQTSSKDDFSKFLEEHPILKSNPSIKWSEIHFEQNMAAVEVEFVSQEHKKTADYRLVHTKDGWKILSLVFMDATVSMIDTQSTEKKDVKTEITKAEMGTTVNLQGVVTNPTTLFRQDVKQITINLFVKNGRKGEDVSLLLEHEETHSRIPAVKVILTQDGDSIINFIVTPPTQGWPVGTYKVYVTPNEGERQVFTYKVES